MTEEIPTRIVWRCPEDDCLWRLNTSSRRPNPEDERQIYDRGREHYTDQHPAVPLPWGLRDDGWRAMLAVHGYPPVVDAAAAVRMLLSDLRTAQRAQAHR